MTPTSTASTAGAMGTCPLQVFVCTTSDHLIPPALEYIQGIAGVHADVTIVPPEEISGVARQRTRGKAVLIVLAQDGSDDSQPANGLDSAEIAMDSPVPVMVLRRSGDTQETFPAFDRIVVPLDGSARAAQALPLASHIAKGAGLPVHLVMVIDPSRVIPPAFAYDPEAWSIITELRETAHWALRQAESPLMRDGVAVEASLLYGPINACLQEMIQPTDMVIMTTHGSGHARGKIGSVAARILESASGPVVMHRGSDQGDIVVDGYEACSWVEPLSRRTGMMTPR